MQHLDLEAGWNWVGLHVYPSSRSIEDILAPIAEQVVLVKDGQGRHYFPAHDVQDITDWDWRHGYMVKVSSPVTLTVAGALIAASASFIALDEGWSLVPYLGNEAMSVEQAFSSLGAAVELVRDAAGRTWRPGENSSDLETIQPGTAYQVHLSSSGYLVYNQSDGATLHTRAELLALSTADLVPGETVTVAGYYTPGDGGGGRFMLIDEPAFGCDAGLVVCPHDQLGPLVSDNTTFTNSWGTRQFTVSQPPVAFGTLTLSLSAVNAGGEPWSISIPDDYMHGTTHQNRDTWARTFNHQTGQFRENREPGGRPMGRYLSAHLGHGFEAEATFSYRPIDGGLRWLRTHDAEGVALPPSEQVWDARWFGCRSHDSAPYFDNTNCLNWALVLAKYTNQANPGRVAEVRLTRNGAGPTTFYYSKSIQVPEGMALSGAAGAQVVETTDDFGNVFYPVRPRPDAVVLKRLPESADGCNSCGHVFDHLDMRRPYGDPHHLPPSPAVLMGNSTTSIQPETGISAWFVRDIVLDGNKEGQDVWADRFSTSDREGYLRNSPGYSGVAQSIHGGKEVSGQNLTIERTYITGYAATGVLTSNHADTTYFYDVSIGDAAYNHAGYLQSPSRAVNLGTHGEAWGHFEIAGGYFENLVAENLLPGRSGANGVFSWRGGDFDTVELCLNNSNRACGSEVIGLYADMRGGNRTAPTQGLGPGIRIKNGIIIARPSGTTRIWHEVGNGYQTGRYHGHIIENVTYYLSGDDIGGSMIDTHRFHKSYFRNIQAVSFGGSEEWSRVIDFRSDERTGVVSPTPHEIVYQGLGSSSVPLAARQLGDVRASFEDGPRRFFLLDSYIDNFDAGILRGRSGSASGTGRIASICESDIPCQSIKMAQLYLDNVHLNANDNRHADGELFFEMSRFKNVTDPTNGATSEDSGSFTCTGASVYERQTNLFWRPHATRGRFEIAGGTNVASVEFVDAQGRTVGPSYLGFERSDARQPIARITFSAPCATGTQVSWDAAVSEWLDHGGQPVTIPDWYPY